MPIIYLEPGHHEVLSACVPIIPHIEKQFHWLAGGSGFRHEQLPANHIGFCVQRVGGVNQGVGRGGKLLMV